MRDFDKIVEDAVAPALERTYRMGYSKGWSSGLRWGAVIMGLVWVGTCIVIAVSP